jgi:HPt (histidine-containing phosphotransfer) domain-containing protein
MKLEQLLAVVRRFLPHADPAAPPAVSLEDADESVTTVMEGGEGNDRPSDAGGVLRSEQLDSEDVRPFLPKFAAELAGQVNVIRDFHAKGEHQSLTGVLHQLKGSGGLYGFPDITRAAAEAERAVKAGDSAAIISSTVENLIAVLRRVDGYERAQESDRAESDKPAAAA